MSLSIILQLAAAAMMPVAASVIIYLCDKKTKFGKLKYMRKQIIIGLIFGGLAVISTEFGINTGTAVMNVRDAAPLCAGLIFGAPAGIIAGVIGGVERWFATLWGASEYTRVACSVATILAGLLAASLRKSMFDNKKPSWLYGLAIACVMEIIHMLLLFITNMTDLKFAFTVIQACSGVMITLNSISVMLAVLCVTILSKDTFRISTEQKKISQTVQFWLMICLLVAFIVGNVFTYVIESRITKSSNEELLMINVDDVKADISLASNENLLDVTHQISSEITSATTRDEVYEISQRYNVAEINIIDKRGVIVLSTDSAFMGYNIADGEQSSEFLVLLEGKEKEYVQDYQSTSFDAEKLRKYAAVVLADGSILQVGYNANQFQSKIAEQVVNSSRNRHIGQTGGVLVCDAEWNITGENISGHKFNPDSEANQKDVAKKKMFKAEIFGNESYCMYDVTEGYYIIAYIPVSEAMFSKEVSIYTSTFMQVIIFAVLFVRLYFLIKTLIVENIQKINNSLAQITNGNLNVTVDVRSNEEFASLSDDINSTVCTLKEYIAQAAARIDKELEFAKSIQHSALPSVFPPFTNRNEFDIYASMYTAKEVGGDFYDFYFTSTDTIAFLMADVSGKGIPAAMFMMTAKTLIKSLAETGADVSDVFTQSNNKLCENNEAGMFVTAWLGVLNLKTGMLSYVNAGHNPPLIRRSNGDYEYVKARSGMVLAGMDGIKYRKNELQLMPGDEIYLYTDGVTEATDLNNELYGEDRLLETINKSKDKSCKELCDDIKISVDEFVGEAPQFDDITMLSLKLNNIRADGRITIVPNSKSTSMVLEYVEKQLEKLELPLKISSKINIAIDELYSNIVNYSSATLAEVGIINQKTKFVLSFKDNGKEFNPLEADEPDITASADDRKIGGLGIFMVRKMAESVEYRYEDGWNITEIVINNL